MFICKLCSVGLPNINSYVQHCRLHSNIPKVRFPCCYKNCVKTLSSYDGLRQHISREHRNDSVVKTHMKFHEVGMSLNCRILTRNTVCTNQASFVKHLHQHIREGMRIECPIKNCTKTYSIRSSFSSHWGCDHFHWSSADLKPEINRDQNECEDSFNELNQHDDVRPQLAAESLQTGEDSSDDDISSAAAVSYPTQLIKEHFTKKSVSVFC